MSVQLSTSHNECPAQPPSQAALGTGELWAHTCTALWEPRATSGAQRGAQGMGDIFPVPQLNPRCCSVVRQGELPSQMVTHHEQLALPAAAASPGAPLQGQGATTDIQGRGRALPVPWGAELYTAQRSCLGPADRKGFSKGKTGQERPSNPPKEIPAHSSRRAVT